MSWRVGIWCCPLSSSTSNIRKEWRICWTGWTGWTGWCSTSLPFATSSGELEARLPLLPWRLPTSCRTWCTSSIFQSGDYGESDKGFTWNLFTEDWERLHHKNGLLMGIMQSLKTMDQRGVQAQGKLYARLLQECARSKSLAEGQQIHDHMLKNRFIPDIFLGNTLISMYAKCGSMVNACKVFQAMPGKDIISWNALIAGYSEHGQGQEAVEHFWQMQREGLKPNKNTFLSILGACVSPMTLELGKQINSRIIKAGFESDVAVGSALISMYCKCGSVHDARKVFDRMPERNVVTWTAMIAGYARQEDNKEAFLFFRKFLSQGVKPNKVTFICILGACKGPKDLEKGKQIHLYIKKAGLEHEVLVGNALLSMYARCGSIRDACQVFDNILTPNLISWNALIAGYGEDGCIEEAFELFRKLQKKGFEPDRFTYASLLSACAHQGDQAALEQGKELHARLLNSGCKSHVSVGTALISMYAKCGSLADAHKVFGKMPQRNVASWNAIIAASIRHGPEMEPFELFQQMQQEGVNPDYVTFITLLSACNSPAMLEKGRKIYSHVVRQRLLSDNSIANALVSMYGRCGSLADAREVFHRIRKRNLSSWNAMLMAYVQNGRSEDAFELFKKFQREGGKGDKFTFINVFRAIANLGDLETGRRLHDLFEQIDLEEDIYVSTTLISMYSKCGSLNDARNVFNKIFKKDLVCWNAMVAACAHNRHGAEALTLFEQMEKEGVMPDRATFASVLSACASLGSLEYGKKIHTRVKEVGLESDIRVSNAIIEMYWKSGSLIHASKVFNKMPAQDVNSWNAIISAYCHHGRGKVVLQYFEQMQKAGVPPNKATFTSVLSSYGQLGLVDEGFDFLESLNEKWKIEPTEEHYACMVEILCRAGLLKEAEEFIDEISLESDALLWGALLVGSRVHRNVELAESVAEHLLDVDSGTSLFVCEQLLSVYAAAHRWEDVAMLSTMQEIGEKEPDCCRIEVNSELHTFMKNSVSHPQREEIYTKLEELANKMKEEGFVMNNQCISRWKHQQEREEPLFQHVDLLAASFSLINTPPKTAMCLVTNVQMSNFSHKMAKFISRTHSSTIFVRDANSFHNFREGICSCGDYW